MSVVLFGGILLVLFILGKVTAGTGAEVLDWDPGRRAEALVRTEMEDDEHWRAAIDEPDERTGRS